MAEKWWWSLSEGRVVSDEERGPDRDVMGPYATREAAESWRETAAARDEEWKSEDERWEGRLADDADAADALDTPGSGDVTATGDQLDAPEGDDRGETGDDPGSGGD